MKNVYSFILVFFLLASCKSDEGFSSNSIMGTWKLVEMLADPGDGSGTFMFVTSSKTIEFMADGSYTSNGNICAFSTLNDGTSEGMYVSTEEGYRIECGEPFVSPLNLQLKNGSLIITFFCIEPCQQKYRRLE
jgi:hypothetical protein